MVFQFHHRKLIETAINETLNRICKGSCQHPTEDSCFPLLCLPVCPTICLYPLPLPHDYSPPPKNSHTHPSTAVVVTLAVLASTFLLVCLSALYLFFYRRRRRRSRSRSLPAGPIPEELFLDQDRGPLVAVDHPIWYINTVGLQPSVISAIAVCKYKRGDGLVEGTDCSVCLSEFREGDTLRLLPKCSHAFHIPCIDTWLRSHANCPMCRAGIVAHRPLSPSPALLGENSSGRRTDAHVGTSDDNGESAELRNHRTAEGRATLSIVQNGCCGNRNEAEAFDGVQPVRRSVSMDPAAAAAIGSALAKNDGPVESAGNSNALSANIDKLNLGTVSKGAGGGNRSLLKVMGTSSSSIGRYLQPGPMSLKRSLSCGGMAEAKNSETLFSNMIISLYGDSF